MTDRPEIQLLANIVAHDGAGRVLLARYGAAAEVETDDADARWFLPAGELDPYDHPDDVARATLDDLAGLTVHTLELAGVQSFRGRRGWHISFDYLARVSGDPDADGPVPAAWFGRQALPRTAHGNWEPETVERVLEGAAA